ncbi:hypothetical protein EV702DRAFT_1197831 [Suillus placidus]|uniref:Uncharacterized protein n=1 Tax=Suillus placidus TaxID=48579 RepID=A0A9P6ZVX8_9AGAM|nr:hypothetical protein EV702DRAFT_1197831 [Suillus placidus]
MSWIGTYKWDEVTETYLVAIQSKSTGDYLGWNAEMKVVMTKSVYWWNQFTIQGKMAFRVPHSNSAESESVNTEGFFTLQMEADYSVILEYQVGEPTDVQLWMLSDKSEDFA